ncbi:hypothetical protein H5410_023671 [Solanum commersonii]|uniref:ATP synthase protein MI25 n=1 Tax=Solanum commersonii TaxID=4109 RepID=A0A9J5ZK51_SOLCO|nr:hypothetical protein H5410_023671 [Solanum commersonii]
MIVALCFIGFIIFCRKSLGYTFKVTFDGRIQAIQEESQQFLNPNEVAPSESNNDYLGLTCEFVALIVESSPVALIVESSPVARCAPKCIKILI